MFNTFVYIFQAEMPKAVKETHENNLQIVFTVICCDVRGTRDRFGVTRVCSLQC